MNTPGGVAEGGDGAASSVYASLGASVTSQRLTV